MNIKQVIVVAIIFHPLLGHGQQLCYSENCLIPKDSLVKQQVMYKDPGASGKQITWDFSQLNPMTDEYILTYNGSIDSICGLEHRTRYYYKQSQNGIWCTGFENPNSFINYLEPVCVIKFPFAYGDTASSYISGEGEYGNGLAQKIEGKQVLKADATGILILSEEKIKAIRIKSEKTYNIMSDDSLSVKQTTYTWYSFSDRYPIFESISTTYKKSDSKDTLAFNASFVYTSALQKQRIEDADNATDWLENKVVDHQTAEITNVDVYPNPAKNTTTVTFTIDINSDVKLYLYNVNGSICYHIKKTANQGLNKWNIPLHNLIEGEYILKITSVESPTSVSKIIIKK